MTDLYDFFDVTRLALPARRRVNYAGCGWMKLDIHYTGRWTGGFIRTEDDIWYATQEQMMAKVWSVEEEKSEDIFVWGVCSGIGTSQIFIEKPSENTSIASVVYKRELNLFPREPKKYKLVPVGGAKGDRE